MWPAALAFAVLMWIADNFSKIKSEKTQRQIPKIDSEGEPTHYCGSKATGRVNPSSPVYNSDTEFWKTKTVPGNPEIMGSHTHKMTQTRVFKESFVMVMDGFLFNFVSVGLWVDRGADRRFCHFTSCHVIPDNIFCQRIWGLEFFLHLLKIISSKNKCVSYYFSAKYSYFS